MSAISLKSITGITSITTPTGVDNQLTLHTNDTTQRVKVTQSGIEVVGVATFQDIDVDGHTNLDNVSIAGVTTASGNITIENAEPSLFLTDTNGNPDYKIFNDQGTLKIYDTTYSAIRLQIGPSNGLVTIAGNTTFTNGITLNPGTISAVNTIAQRLGDTDTKIRFPAADTFSVETAGSERLRITSSGFVGVGTATVGRGPLELSRSDTGDVQIHMTNAKTGGGTGNGFTIFGCNSTHGDAGFVNRHNGGALEFYTNHGGTIAEKLRITSDGKVGINRTAPAAPITARRTDAGGTGTSGVIAEFANSSGYGVWFGQSSASGASWGATTGDFYWNTGGLSSQVERLRIDSSGNFKMPDDAHIRLGGSQTGVGDLQLYHTANNSYIHGKTGLLQMKNEGGNIDLMAWNSLLLRVNAGEVAIDCNHNGSVDLYHNNQIRAYTGSDGFYISRVNTFSNPNNTGSETQGAMIDLGGNIHFKEIHPTGAYTDRCDLVLNTNSGYGQGLSDKIRITAGGQIGIGRDSSGTINTRAVLELCAQFTDVSDNDGSADQGTNNHDAILINVAGTGGASGRNVGSIAWDKGGRRRAAIMAEYQSTDDDYMALSFFTRGTDGSGDFYKSFIVNHNGSASLHGSLSQNTSDDRLKKDKVEISNALDKVNSLSSFTHKWNDIAVRAGLEENKIEIGLSAQEVQALYPSLVDVNNTMIDPDNPDTEYLTVHYEKIVPLLVASIKELKSEIEQLKSQINN